VGGRLIRAPGSRHVGGERVYWDAAPVLRMPDGALAMRQRERRRSLGDLATARTTFQTGRVRTTLSLGTGGTYNRIEGLPITFGPLFEFRPGRRSLARVELRGILRTAGGGNQLRSDFGYTARGELRFSGGADLGIAGRLYSVLESIEDQPLSASESGWSAFLLQRDYRDYFERQGAGGSVFVEPTRALRLEASLRHDAERSVRTVDPWSLLRNSDRWRRNPLVDDGHYTTAALQLAFDTRNGRAFPTSGWLIRARIAHTTSSDIAPVSLPPVVRPGIPGADYGFERLTVDVRRYTRLTPTLRVNARLRADGWLSGDRLPVQQRVSLGGPDILPGYAFRAVNCAPEGYDDPARTALCDRAIAAQVEVRTRLSLGLGYREPDRTGGPGRFIGIDEADLVFFGDAGTGWLAGPGPGQVPVNRIPVLGEWKYDVGVGIDADAVGAYLAKGFSSGEPIRLFVRLQRRF
jgi:Omp85 superfamily domain